MTTFTVTVSSHPLKNPSVRTENAEPKTFQTFDTLDKAVTFFTYEISGLDTGCVEIWQNQNRIGHLYI